MSFAQAIVDSVLKIAEEKNAKKVLGVELELGKLLMLNPDQLEFCFQVITQGTILEGAELKIDFIQPIIECTSCGRKYDEYVGICDCGGILRVEGGKEMIIKKVAMEVE
jgi:hydrogenase nickel incorporation protein HypA/HybF